ncbi:hypothetical protein [Amycolatopsis taiwanensis]|uniref:hypothetical protein n=1 Tax=Amycolatopsis taiwanensis TaxID=342230 RepID=UPI0004BCFB3E|nr:hypothetical protein [Amycolatopsis taiwanensis]
MSYPPQPGQPQPDPYGRQGLYGQQPNAGGFPPQQQYGHQPYPGGYPQGQFGGYGGPQPPKKKTGLWVGLGILAVAVAAFLITGLAAPGFLLSKDNNGNNQAAPGDLGGTSGQPGSSPQATVQAMLTALNAKDTATLISMKCADASSSVQAGIDDIDAVERFEMGPPGTETPTSYEQTLMVTAGGRTAPYTGTLAKEGGKWCWQGLKSGSSSSSSRTRSSS